MSMLLPVEYQQQIAKLKMAEFGAAKQPDPAVETRNAPHAGKRLVMSDHVPQPAYQKVLERNPGGGVGSGQRRS